MTMPAREQLTRATAVVHPGPTIEELEDHLKYDERDLGSALRDQSDLFYRAARKVAHRASTRDMAKILVEEAEAEAADDIRQADEGSKKPSVDEVKSRVTLDPRVKKAKRDLAKATYEHAKYAALKDAFVQRGYAIKDHVALTVGSGGTVDVDAIKADLHQQRTAYEQQHPMKFKPREE